ncbi:MFS polyamine transporter [Lactarius akahatsu]|uniref:MFS polyamine transporter n=1 Tax=Lactarius akahatsu TaxID=416441 RepID=A0AAD4LEM6_9AGAM|nr:MFS polyamine transporter [Lactarius akahatsu]
MSFKARVKARVAVVRCFQYGVPKSGDLGRPNDPANPQNYNLYRHHTQRVCLLRTINQALIIHSPLLRLSHISVIAYEFHVGREAQCCWFVLGPTFGTPGSEHIGRSLVFVCTSAVSAITYIGQARANNMVIVAHQRRRDHCIHMGSVNPAIEMCVLSTAILFGPVLGPIISTFITSSDLGWRWIFWVLMTSTGSCASLSKHLRAADPVGNKGAYAVSERVAHSKRWWLNRSCYSRKYTSRSCMVSSTGVCMLPALWAVFEAIPVYFKCICNFFIANDDLWYGSSAEERLHSAMVGGPMLAKRIVVWWVPGMGMIPIGLWNTLIVISFSVQLLGGHLPDFASAIAGQTILRSLTGTVFPLFTTQMFVNVGINWASTLLGAIAVLLVPMPFLFYKYGSHIRTRNSFTPCTDLKVAKFLEQEKEGAVKRCVQQMAY